MNPYNKQYPTGELVVTNTKGEVVSLVGSAPLSQTDYTLFRLPASHPDEAPSYAFHHGIGGRLKMYVRKVGVKQGLRLPLQTMIGQTYTVRYRFERERVIGDPTKAPAPSAIVRVTNDELGKGLLQEKIHHAVLGWGGTLFPEETPKRFSFWVQASALKETDQLWVTPFNDQDQALDTGSSVTIESGTLQLDPHYLGEAYLRGRYTGPMTGAYLYGGGSSSPLRKGGDFYADGRFQFYVSGLDLSQLPVTLVPYNAVGDVVTVDQEVPIRKGKLSSHAYLLGASQVTALIRETFRWPNFKSIKTRLKPHGEGPLRIKRIPFMCTQAGLPRPRML